MTIDEAALEKFGRPPAPDGPIRLGFPGQASLAAA